MAENTDLYITVEAWADIMIENWVEKIGKLGIGYSFNLETDMAYEVIGTRGNLPQAVAFTFPYYGKFVDMGVGKGVKLEDVKTGRAEHYAGVGGHRRKPKPWYGKTLYGQTIKLTEILSSKFGILSVFAIVEQLDDRHYQASL